MAHRGGVGGGRGRSKNRPTPYDRPEEFQIPKLQGGPGMEPGDQEDGGGIVPPPPPLAKKFTNKARLFFGNLPRDFTEEELRQILAAHGEVQEVYHNKEKNFAFARMVLFLVTMTSCILYPIFIDRPTSLRLRR